MGVQDGLQVGGRAGGSAVQPDNPVIAAKPGPLPAHIASGADEGGFARAGSVAAGIEVAFDGMEIEL